MDENLEEKVCYAQPTTLADRVAIANDFVKRYSYPIPFAVDGLDNAAMKAFSAWPERLYIVDEKGAFAYCGECGPFGYHPGQVEEWLKNRFGEKSASAAGK